MPAFQGFSREAFRFLADLAKNNNREWFQPRKNEFEALIRRPMIEFANDINETLAKVAPEFVADPAKAVYRIYRDTRFSPNKAPYKTHQGVYFSNMSLGKDRGSGFYAHISADHVMVAGGLYFALPPDVLLIRQSIVEREKEFRKILAAKAIKDLGGVSGDSLVRPPKGFAADHPAIDLLLRKQWLVGQELPVDVGMSGEFLLHMRKTIKALTPLCQFLNAALEGGGKTKDPLLRKRTMV